MAKPTILPLGSMVHLVNGEDTQILMIVARGAITEVNGKSGYFDYAAVLYPNGLVDPSQMFFFNRENVKDIVFLGFRDAREQIFAEGYDQSVASVGYPKLSVDE